MANSYSIEIGGRFNAAQLQTELNKIKTLKVDVRVNAQAIQKTAETVTSSLTKSGAGLKQYYNGIDALIAKNEASSRQFSAQLQQQMLTEQRLAKAETQYFMGLHGRMKEVEASAKATGDTFGKLYLKVLSWTIVTTAVFAPIKAFKEALATMKEVDSELVTIQKVTDLTKAQIDELTESIYSMASAYGRTADELLAMTSTFARAGFQDNLEQMTELSALLQNVGDLSAEDSSKFILAANAAWKLGGNYDALMRIIDGMNEVTNKSANDMQGLTDAVTVAGSVFANAGESAQTFTAMVGTVIAATQRSGSEVGRGLRTIAMNIRQIKGELEDGEIIDEASISDAAAALHSVGVSVSQNGDLRKVSDVLSDLAGKWESLTRAEQSYVSNALAGKRQANVLIALMQNYAEYQYELENYANGAGSALRENEIYLNSWEAKTKVLSSTWTAFVSKLVDTTLIKMGLDAVISVLDSINGILDAFKAGAHNLDNLNREYDKLFGKDSEYARLLENAESLTATEKRRLDYLEAQRAALQDQINLEEQSRVRERFDQQHREYRDLLVDPTDANNTSVVSFDSYSAYQYSTQSQKLNEALSFFNYTGDASAFRDALSEIESELEDTYDLFETFPDMLNEDDKRLQSFTSSVMALYAALQPVNESVEEASEKTDRFVDSVQTLKIETGLVTSAIDEYNASGRLSQATMDALLQKYPQLYTQIEAVADGYKVEDGVLQGLIADHEQEAAKMEYLARTAAIAYINGLDNASKAQYNLGLQTNATTAEIIRQLEIAREIALSTITQNVVAPTVANYGGEVARNMQIINTEAVKAAGDRLRNAEQLLARIRAVGNARSYYGGGGSSSKSGGGGGGGSSRKEEETDPTAELIREKKAEFDYAIWLSQQQQGLLEKDTQAYKDKTAEQAEYYVAIQKWAHEEADRLRSIDADKYESEIQNLQKYWWEAQNWLKKNAEDTMKDLQSNVKTALKQLKDNLDDQTDSLDAQITRIKALIDLEEKYNAIQKTIRDEQADIAEQLRIAKESYQYLDEETRKLLFNESDYKELSKELRDIQKETTDLYAEYQDKISKLNEDNIYEAEILTSQYEQQLEAKQKEYEIAKANLALAKAQTQLNNAQQNRNTLMLINGQFQWVADPKAVKSALEELAEAESDAAEARRDLTETEAINSKKALQTSLEEQKSRIEAEYKAISKAWERLSDSMENPVRDIQQTLQELADGAAPEFKAQIYALAQTISALTGYAFNLDGMEDAGTVTINGKTITAGKPSATGLSGGYGRTAKANSEGNAPTGLAERTTVFTRGGTYQIVAPGTAGAKYNPDSGYYSIKIDDKATYDSGGLALGTGIMLKATKGTEGVLNPNIMSGVLNPQKNALFDTFVSSLTKLFGNENGGMTFTGGGTSSSLIDNSITVNGMEVTGRKGESLADALTQIMPLHAGGRI